MTAIAFAVAAFAGTLIRAAASGGDSSFARRMWATLAVNLAGAFLLGWMQGVGSGTMTAVGVGGLGAVTTFSTFVSQVECIMREGRTRDAAAYALGTVILGVLVAWVGVSVS